MRKFLVIALALFFVGCSSIRPKKDPCRNHNRAAASKTAVGIQYGVCDFNPAEMQALAKRLENSRKQATRCFNRVYGEKQSIPYISTVYIEPNMFRGKKDGQLKHAEFVPGPRTMYYHPERRGSLWYLYEWVWELHTVYRLNLLGMRDLYNPNKPAPGLASKAQEQCVEPWR